MSHQCIADAIAPAEARQREEMMENTWGHLAPKKGKTYRGYITFAVGCLGSDNLNPTILELEMGDLDSSPWFYDAVSEFLSWPQCPNSDECYRRFGWREEAEEMFPIGGVYRFDGTFHNYRFKGQIVQLSHPSAGKRKLFETIDIDWKYGGEED